MTRSAVGAEDMPRLEPAAGGAKRVPKGSGASALLPHSGGQLGLWRKLPLDIQPPVFNLAGG